MNELELRERLAERETKRANHIARGVCVVASKACRAGEPEDWLELEHAGRVWNFCPAHALTAEVLAAPVAGALVFFDGVTPDEIIQRIRAVEARHR